MFLGPFICEVAYCDGLLESLSALSYRITNPPCEKFDPKVAMSLDKTATQYGCNSVFKVNPGMSVELAKAAAERSFFDLSKAELLNQNRCQSKKLDSTLNSPEQLSSLKEDIKEKVPMLAELKKQLNERLGEVNVLALQERIANSPNIINPSREQKMIKAKIEQINKEAADLMAMRQMILDSIPLADNYEIKNFIDDLDSSKVEEKIENNKRLMDGLVSAANKAVARNKSDLHELVAINSNTTDLPRDFKIRVAQTDGLVEHMRDKYKIDKTEFAPLRCQIDEKYGIGSKKLESIVTGASFLLGIGAAGVIAKTTVIGAEEIMASSSIARTIAVRTLFAASSGEFAHNFKEQCLRPSEVTSIVEQGTSHDNCEERNVKQVLRENNCALSLALPVLGISVTAVQKSKKAMDLLSNFLNKLSAKKNMVTAKPSEVTQPFGTQHDAEATVPFGNPRMSPRTSDVTEPFIAPPNREVTLPFTQPVSNSNNSTVQFFEGDAENASKLTKIVKPAAVPQLTSHPYQRIQDLIRTGQLEKARQEEAKIINTLSGSKMTDAGHIGRGISQGHYVKFEDETYGIWKPYRVTNSEVPNGYQTGQNEIMAYKVDRYLGLNRVPTTVERSMDGVRGTVQLMVGDLRKVELTKNPPGLTFFDSLISNSDRNKGNYLITKDGRNVPIDHGNASIGKMTPPSFSSGLNSAKAEYEIQMRNIDQQKLGIANPFKAHADANEAKSHFYQRVAELVGTKNSYLKMQMTDEAKWRSILGPELNNGQIQRFLNQRQAIIKSVEEFRKNYGDEIFQAGPASTLLGH
jgi:chorismate mutase